MGYRIQNTDSPLGFGSGHHLPFSPLPWLSSLHVISPHEFIDWFQEYFPVLIGKLQDGRCKGDVRDKEHIDDSYHALERNKNIFPSLDLLL